MESVTALQELAEVTSHQGGMVTSTQAAALGISRLSLSRLAGAGHLDRVAHGVYRDAGAPEGEFDDLRAAWLSTEPRSTAEQRLKEPANGVVIAGESAAGLHGVGNFRALQHDFVSPARRQTQRPEVRYRQRTLDAQDVIIVYGLPCMTIERTLADLVEDRVDLSLIAGALRDAAEKRSLDLPRLRSLLAPLAQRNGFSKEDGEALLDHLLRIGGIDTASVAGRIAKDPALSVAVVEQVMTSFAKASRTQLAEASKALESWQALQSSHEAVWRQIHESPSPIAEAKKQSEAFRSLMATPVALEAARKDISELVKSFESLRKFADDWPTARTAVESISSETLRLAIEAQNRIHDE